MGETYKTSLKELPSKKRACFPVPLENQALAGLWLPVKKKILKKAGRLRLKMSVLQQGTKGTIAQTGSVLAQ